jgi:uncharacterized membrane protein (UPF0127 family)
MLVKAHSEKYLEDFGLVEGSLCYLYDRFIYGDERGDNPGKGIPVAKISSSPVVRVNAVWVNLPLKVRCAIADTTEKKIIGLQETKSLQDGEGMFFPYHPQGAKVAFHQGTVSFPLDVIFLKDSEIVQIEADTRVGSSENWTCRDCSGVIEVRAGYCFENDVNVGDRIAMFAVSERDLDLLEQDRKSAAEEDSSYRSWGCSSHALNLMSIIADSL